MSINGFYRRILVSPPLWQVERPSRMVHGFAPGVNRYFLGMGSDISRAAEDVPHPPPEQVRRGNERYLPGCK